MGQLVHLEGVQKYGGVELTSSRRFTLGRVLRYSMMFPWLIRLDTMRKAWPFIDTPSNGSMLGCDSLLQITTSLQNLYVNI